MEIKEYTYLDRSKWGSTAAYRNMNYVASECRRLAKQLAMAEA